MLRNVIHQMESINTFETLLSLEIYCLDLTWIFQKIIENVNFNIPGVYIVIRSLMYIIN